MRIVGRWTGLLVIVGMLALTYMWGRWDERTQRAMPLAGVAHAATSPSSTSPVGVVDPRDVYYPGSEALAPNGRIVLAEFRLEDPKVPIKLLHKMSKKQILKELPANGFKLVEEFDKLPWQHLMFFERDDSK